MNQENDKMTQDMEETKKQSQDKQGESNMEAKDEASSQEETEWT